MGKRIENVLDGFDFEKVAKYMKFAGWTWGGIGSPNVDQLRAHAKRYLKRAKREHRTISCGGFICSYRNKQYDLIFYVDHNYED